MLCDSCQTLLAIFGDSDYLDVGFEVEEPRKGSSHHGLVFCEDGADHEGFHRMAYRSVALFRLSLIPNGEIPPAAITPFAHSLNPRAGSLAGSDPVVSHRE